jgi:hypothetical protein
MKIPQPRKATGEGEEDENKVIHRAATALF